MSVREPSAREALLRSLSPELVAAIEQLVTERVDAVVSDALSEHGNGAAWLTLEQAGSLLGCSADAVRMRVKRGRLESSRQGRRVYVSRESLDRLA